MNWIAVHRRPRTATARRSSRLSALIPLIFMALVGLTAGCGGDDTQTPSNPDASGDTTDQPPEVTETSLQPAGVTATTHAAVGASEDALEHPVALSTDLVSDTSDVPSLPPEASAAGDHLELTAARDINIDYETSPLFLALPIPDDVDPSNLALGVLPPDDTDAHQRREGTRSWSVISGMQAPDRGLFVVPVRFLLEDGLTLSLVESEDYDASTLPDSTDTEESSERTRLIDAAGEPTDAVQTAIEEASDHLESASTHKDFYVVCRGFEPDQCTDTHRQKVREHLQSVEDDFSNYRSPALRRTLPGRTVEGTEGRFYKYVLRPDDSQPPCSDGDGLFPPTTRLAVTCLDPSDDDPPRATTREMYAHAVQYAYPFFDWTHADKQRVAWLLEGPATFAKNTDSGDTDAVRWERNSESDGLRHVDTPLTEFTGESPFPAAGTQDFWVYALNHTGQSPHDVFVPLWDESPSTRAVNSYLDLTDMHWGWVRNQAFEAHETDGNRALNGTCVPDSDAWASVHRTISFDAFRSGSLSEEVELDGHWRAGIVEVEVENTVDSDIKVTLTGESDAGYLKAYPDRDSPDSHCLYRHERPSTTKLASIIGEGETQTLYVLVSNSPDVPSESRDYDIDVSIEEPSLDRESPTITVERPIASNHPLERDTLFLKAQATDPGGGFVEPLEWTVTDSEGTSKSYTGNDLAIDDFWDEGFEPGTFTFEILATDDDGQESVVTVESDIERE